ncbi:MAG: VOC family protein, partial [Bacillota bacterium]
MQLDHVVQAVHDREGAAEALRARGLHVVTGGEHPRWGTHNALAYFEDLSYVELIAVREPAVAAVSDFGAPILRFLEQGEGVATVALRTTAIEADVARLRSRGIAMGDPREGSRRLPDGTLLTWRLALAPWPLPFLIEWGAPDETRRADLAR